MPAGKLAMMVAGGLVLGLGSEAGAAWVPLDDFQGYQLSADGTWAETIDAKSSKWVSNRGDRIDQRVVVDPQDASNQVGRLQKKVDGNATMSLQISPIADGSTSTIYHRLMLSFTDSANRVDTRLGVTSVTNTWNNFDELKVRPQLYNATANGAAYTFAGAPMQWNAWYEVWWVLDNAAGTGNDRYSLYVKGDTDLAYAGQTALEANVPFAQQVSDSLQSFFISMYVTHYNYQVHLDDFHQADGVELSSAIPEPASLALAGMAGLALLHRRRPSR